ncbi:hypothetical protein PCH70_50800 [Pseudomonas cichorii JBC1]|nr:hypothetical protein PCH70_50800 [Pseudomonas cichorii JBC1]
MIRLNTGAAVYCHWLVFLESNPREGCTVHSTHMQACL